MFEQALEAPKTINYLDFTFIEEKPSEKIPEQHLIDLKLLI